MKKMWFVLLTIGLLLSGCNTITDSPDEFANISEENIREFEMLDGWKQIDPKDTSQHFINDDRSWIIIIEESDRPDSGDLNPNEYLGNISRIYNLGGIVKVMESEIVEEGHEQFGLMELETNVGDIYSLLRNSFKDII